MTLSDPIVFPVIYELSINEGPDEIYCVVNHGVDRYQNLSFGVSPAPGNDSGIWINGTCGQAANFGHANAGFYYDGNNAAPIPNAGNNNEWFGAGILASVSNFSHAFNAYFIRDTEGWQTQASYPETGSYAGSVYAYQLLSCLPSAANQATVLLPIYATKMADSFGTQITASLRHARHCRIDNEAPGAVVPFGSDRWKIYPAYRKDAAVRSPDLPPNGFFRHTGTYGYAVRYHGP